jgi:Protein of unknown function (DUF2975)
LHVGRCLIEKRCYRSSIRSCVRRIRVLAALTLGYFVLNVAPALLATVIQNDLGLERATPDISFAPIVSAVVLLALGQIWQHGVTLRRDQELTI